MAKTPDSNADQPERRQKFCSDHSGNPQASVSQLFKEEQLDTLTRLPRGVFRPWRSSNLPRKSSIELLLTEEDLSFLHEMGISI